MNMGNLYLRMTLLWVVGVLASFSLSARAEVPMPMVDTGQVRCADNYRFIACPEKEGRSFFGQDAYYQGNQPSYGDNHDGTVTDRVTGLMWSAAVDETKVSLTEANAVAAKMRLGGYSDWRVPNIKELYSLMNFAGDTGSPERTGRYGYPTDAVPFIDTDYFDFRYGNTAAGERYIDAQWLSSTQYVSTTMDGMKTLFGVNFADGRIKGYGYQKQWGGPVIKKFYIRYVRGPVYGENEFNDNGDGTVTDKATGLVWMQADSEYSMTWEEALEFAEMMVFDGASDWRLPNAKELQYIVDYTRSPDTTGSAAIDPVFRTTPIVNEAGQKDFPFFWTSTTHKERSQPGRAVYIAFGRAIGRMWGRVMDVHGAGAQRSDPKTGTPQLGGGPQGDAVRIKNFVRLVRGGNVAAAVSRMVADRDRYPNKIRVLQNTLKMSSDSSTRYMHPGNRMQMPGPHRRDQGMGPGMDQGMGPGMEQGSRPGMGQGMGQGMRPGMGQGMGQAAFIHRHDRNGDDKVSRSEFGGPPDHFRRFDKNNDGYIEESEAPTGPPPGKRSRMDGPSE